MAFNLYDTVKITANTYYDGKKVPDVVKTWERYIQKIEGDKVWVGDTKSAPSAGHTTGIVKIDGLTLVKAAEGSATAEDASSSTATTEVVDAKKETNSVTTEQLDSTLYNLMNESMLNEDPLKYNMRLHGIPHQFSKYCDSRLYSYMSKYSGSSKSDEQRIGRKFMENIMLEAPHITIIPGGPSYLPAAKNKVGLSAALISASNNNINQLADLVKDEKIRDKLRYYDFKQDYLGYMRYVNAMCAMLAGMLGIGDKVAPWGNTNQTFIKYLWQNYRWQSDSYSFATANAMSVIGNAVKSTFAPFVSVLKSGAISILNKFAGKDLVKDAEGKDDETTVNQVPDSTNIVEAFTPEEDKSLLETLEDMLTQVNYVQFFIESDGGVSESNDNNHAQSKLAGIFDSGQELLKEAAFIGNSSGINTEELVKSLNEGVEKLNETLFSGEGTASGVLNRLLSNVNNVVKGENIIFPEIYQSSTYRKTYSVSIDLRTPYGNIMSYYLNILVPLAHLLCLALPRQETANTYGSPFLIRAYYPGVFTCNLGLVESISIDKNATGDGWSVDGFPTHVKVTLNIVDLYSDLTISSAKDPTLFMANSSLIEYLATSCGLDLTRPQLRTRITNAITMVKHNFSWDTMKEGVQETIFNSLEDLISALTRV